jgi:hypothetical protein
MGDVSNGGDETLDSATTDISEEITKMHSAGFYVGQRFSESSSRLLKPDYTQNGDDILPGISLHPGRSSRRGSSLGRMQPA